MSNLISEIQEIGNQLFEANNELMAITELIDVQDVAELKMSEWGRSGLAAMLHRISGIISEANVNLPTGYELNERINKLAIERATSIAVKRMDRNCGDMEAGHE